jgi:hypothetical protein
MAGATLYPEQRFIKPETLDETSFRDHAEILSILSRTWGRLAELEARWVKAVLAVSRYVQPFLLRRTPVGLGAPVMYQGGSLNFGISPALHRAMAPTTSRRRRNIVELKGAGHFAWTDLRRTFHDPIVAGAPLRHAP